MHESIHILFTYHKGRLLRDHQKRKKLGSMSITSYCLSIASEEGKVAHTKPRV